MWELSSEATGEHEQFSIYPRVPVVAGTEFWNENRSVTYHHVPELNNLNWRLVRMIHVEGGGEVESDNESSSSEDIGKSAEKFMITCHQIINSAVNAIEL